MSHKSAYDKAIQFIMQDPEHNICEITWWLVWGYTLKCWTVSNTTPTTFSHRGGEHFLFFSKMLFKWKDHVHHGLPRRRRTPGLVSRIFPSVIQGKTKDEYNSYQVRHLRFIKLLSGYFTLSGYENYHQRLVPLSNSQCECNFFSRFGTFLKRIIREVVDTIEQKP